MNTLWLFSQKFFSLLVSFIVGAYIARYLGPKDFGLMSYTFSFVGIFAAFSTLGVDEILKRELVKNKDRKQELMSTGFWIKALGSCATILLIFFVSYVFHGLTPKHFFIVLYSFTFLFQSFDIFDIFFQSQVEAKYSVHVRLGVTFVGALVKVFGIWSGQGIVWFIWVYLAESMAIGVGFWLSYQFRYSKFDPKYATRAIARELLGSSWPLVFSGIAIMLYMKVDQVFIGNMLSISSVGLYATAVRLSEIWYTIPVVLCASLFPAIVRAKVIDPTLYRTYLQKLYFILFWMGFTIALGVTIFAHILINTLFGSSYLAAVPVLQVYVWGGIGVFVGVELAYYLMIENQTKIFFMTTLCGGISNIVLNLILIPRLGIIGSAIATVISYSLVVFSIVLFKDTRKHALFVLRSIVLWQ